MGGSAAAVTGTGSRCARCGKEVRLETRDGLAELRAVDGPQPYVCGTVDDGIRGQGHVLDLHGVFHDFRSGIMTLRAPGNASIRVVFLTRQGVPLGVLNARPGEVREAEAWGDLYQVEFTPATPAPVPAKDTA